MEQVWVYRVGMKAAASTLEPLPPASQQHMETPGSPAVAPCLPPAWLDSGFRPSEAPDPDSSVFYGPESAVNKISCVSCQAKLVY